MWVGPLAALDRPVAVVVRSHQVFDALEDVSVPVICTPYNGTIATLPLPDRVVALFVTHSGNNVSLIRRPEVRSVFVGHGDSDKPDSVNPFARVYDEVWVAGRMGRRRYQQAAVGVRDSAVVEVGRPQIAVSKTPPVDPPTVVYAPTWEGWGDDPHHSSLAHVGVELVETLAARSDVQVRYRPHPLTGRRSRDLRAAHQRIVELVGAVPEAESLAETFAASAGLIGDVSSVINDYLPYDRPYAVLDTRGIGRAEFVERFPSGVGGFVLPPDLDGLDEFVAAVLGGADATRTIRREHVADTLGDPATAPQRFANAVSRLLSG
jgi:CDP-Glycerol:Poly(glycerophosphate) glycerophosphotransferase